VYVCDDFFATSCNIPSSMQSLAVLLLFVGMFMVVHGVYEEKLRTIHETTRVEYRFIPRTLYEEQMANAGPGVTSEFSNLFDASAPWYARATQEIIGSPGPFANRGMRGATASPTGGGRPHPSAMSSSGTVLVDVGAPPSILG